MFLKQKIQTDIKEAMKQKNQTRVSVLRLCLAAALVREKEKRAKLSRTEKDQTKLETESELNDSELMEVLRSEAKKMNDSIEQFGKGQRQDLVEKEQKELNILKEYLPPGMDEGKIREIVQEKIKEIGSVGPKDKGRVMAALMPVLKGKADGGVINKIVGEELK